MGWPRGFERPEPERKSPYQLLAILLTAIIAVGTVLTGPLPEEMRSGVLAFSVDFLAKNAPYIIASVTFVSATVVVIYTLT